MNGAALPSGAGAGAAAAASAARTWGQWAKDVASGAVSLPWEVIAGFGATGATWQVSRLLASGMEEFAIDMLGGSENLSMEEQQAIRSLCQPLGLMLWGRPLGEIHGTLSWVFNRLREGVNEKLGEKIGIRLQTLDSPVVRETIHAFATLGFALSAGVRYGQGVGEALRGSPRLQNAATQVSGAVWSVGSAIVAGAAVAGGWIAGTAHRVLFKAPPRADLNALGNLVSSRAETAARCTRRVDVALAGLLNDLITQPKSGLARGFTQLSMYLGGLIEGYRYYAVCVDWFKGQREWDGGKKPEALPQATKDALLKFGMPKTVERLEREIAEAGEVPPAVARFAEQLVRIGLHLGTHVALLAAFNPAAFKPEAEHNAQMLDANTATKVASGVIGAVLQFAVEALAAEPGDGKARAAYAKLGPQADAKADAEEGLRQRRTDARREFAIMLAAASEFLGRFSLMTDARAGGILQSGLGAASAQASFVAMERVAGHFGDSKDAKSRPVLAQVENWGADMMGPLVTSGEAAIGIGRSVCGGLREACAWLTKVACAGDPLAAAVELGQPDGGAVHDGGDEEAPGVGKGDRKSGPPAGGPAAGQAAALGLNSSLDPHAVAIDVDDGAGLGLRRADDGERDASVSEEYDSAAHPPQIQLGDSANPRLMITPLAPAGPSGGLQPVTPLVPGPAGDQASGARAAEGSQPLPGQVNPNDFSADDFLVRD
jgi:hypothetical protein